MLARRRHEDVQRACVRIDAAHEPQRDEVRLLRREGLEVARVGGDVGDVLGGRALDGDGGGGGGEGDDADDGAVEDGGERAGRGRFAKEHDGEEVARGGVEGVVGEGVGLACGEWGGVP